MDSAPSTAELEQQFDETFDCFVISLARTPQRMAAFLGRNGATGVKFKRFEAADGNAISMADAVVQSIVKPGTRWETKGAIGVALSHRRLWDKAIADGRSLVVFEDDAYLRADIRARSMRAIAPLGDWDIVLLGYNIDSLLEVDLAGDLVLSGLFTPRHPSVANLEKLVKSEDPVMTLRLRHAFGLCGYAISPAGAKKLRESVFPMDNRMLEFPATRRHLPVSSIDAMMNAFFRTMSSHVCVPPLVLTENNWAKSTTVKPGMQPGTRGR